MLLHQFISHDGVYIQVREGGGNAMHIFEKKILDPGFGKTDFHCFHAFFIGSR